VCGVPRCDVQHTLTDWFTNNQSPSWEHGKSHKISRSQTWL